MCGGSGGGEKSGRTGGGSTNGDAGQPGEVVREANKANGQIRVEGGVPITKNISESQLIAAHASIVTRTEKSDAEYDAAMKSFVSSLKSVGVSEKSFPEGSTGSKKLKRFYKSYG